MGRIGRGEGACALRQRCRLSAIELRPPLRALLQRRRNRDLFDLHEGLEQLPGVRWTDADAIHAFERVWTELIARIGGEPWKLDSRRRECCREPSRSNFRSVEHS